MKKNVKASLKGEKSEYARRKNIKENVSQWFKWVLTVQKTEAFVVQGL